MNKKQPETRERTKRVIKDAFWDLYKEKAIDKITVKDITTEAGFNRSTFYAYFIDVYDVLDQIEEDVMPGVEHLPPAGRHTPSPDFMAELINIYDKNSEYYSVLLSERGDPHFAIKMKNIFKHLMKTSMADILKGQSLISDIEFDYALEFFTGASISVIKHWYDQDKNIPMTQLVPLMYQLMNNAFVERLSGYKGIES